MTTQNTVTDRSRLAQVTECAGENCFAPTVFAWTDGEAVSVRKAGRRAAGHMLRGSGKTADYRILPGDYNGDSKTDIAAVSRAISPDSGWFNSIYMELSNGTGFDSLAWDAGFPPGHVQGQRRDGRLSRIIPGDYNGDGLTDLSPRLGAPRAGQRLVQQHLHGTLHRRWVRIAGLACRHPHPHVQRRRRHIRLSDPARRLQRRRLHRSCRRSRAPATSEAADIHQIYMAFSRSGYFRSVWAARLPNTCSTARGPPPTIIPATTTATASPIWRPSAAPVSSTAVGAPHAYVELSMGSLSVVAVVGRHAASTYATAAAKDTTRSCRRLQRRRLHRSGRHQARHGVGRGWHDNIYVELSTGCVGFSPRTPSLRIRPGSHVPRQQGDAQLPRRHG
ncbi:MAG: VCBS repeat-containing protein [Caldilineaceae bacterium]